MKRITEAELHNEYLQRGNSKAAWLTFGAGFAGAILCVVVFFLFDQFLSDVKKLADYANENRFELPPAKIDEIKKEIDDRTIAFSKIGIPLFLVANICWIIGGFSWSIDLKRNPTNQFIWKLGGIMVLVTAVACGIAWFLLIRLNMQAG